MTLESARADTSFRASVSRVQPIADGSEGSATPKRGRSRWLRSASLLLVALSLAGGSGFAQQFKEVAVLEMQAPRLDSFIVRATVPVPPGTFPRPDGRMPLAILDWKGAVRATQVEAVSWYPNSAKSGADVVEVMARVNRPPGSNKGDIIHYSVVQFPHAAEPQTLHPDVKELLDHPQGVILQSRDVHGNLYRSNLLRGRDGRKTMRLGRNAIQERNYEMMLPVEEAKGLKRELPHFMGVHAYVTTWDREPQISLDLRVHNGPSGFDKSDSIDDPMADLYFKSLEIRVPKGWAVVSDWSDPFLGDPYETNSWSITPIVKPNPGGKLHLLPVQSQFHRRLVLVKRGEVKRAQSLIAEEWLAFVTKARNEQGEPTYSWWNPDTARYFPQRHRLPELDHLGKEEVRGRMDWKLDTFSTLLESGEANGGPIFIPILGWAHCWGVKYGGMTSGTEIYLYDGINTAYGASQAGYRWAQIRMRMYTARHPVAIYNRNGDPTQLRNWITHGPDFDYVHMLFYLKWNPEGNDPFGYTDAPTHQVDFVQMHNRMPDYEEDLKGFKAIDIQHHIRYTRNAKVLAWLGNDALAKDELRMSAEVVRMSYHPYPVTPSGGLIPSGMATDLDYVSKWPGTGYAYGRGEGWTLDTMNAYYSVADEQWRAGARPWFDLIVGLVEQGQAECSGFIQRQVNKKTLDGKYFARKSTESSIIDNAIYGMRESVYRGYDANQVQRLQKVLLKSVRAAITFPSWDFDEGAPVNALAVAPLESNEAVYCKQVPPDGTSDSVDRFQCWSSLGYGWEISGDPIYFDRAADLANTHDLIEALKKGKFKNLENNAALFADALEELGP